MWRFLSRRGRILSQRCKIVEVFISNRQLCGGVHLEDVTFVSQSGNIVEGFYLEEGFFYLEEVTF